MTIKNERKQISKKLRFDVFKRDLFSCQYCGSSSPSVVLEIDHIHPVSKGGTNAIHNLVTACFDCNRGKTNALLSSIPESIRDKALLIKEKEDQIKQFNKLLASIRKREDIDIKLVEVAFQKTNQNHQFSASFRETVRKFLFHIPSIVLVAHMENSCSKFKDMDRATKYFCGICWNIIKDGKNG